MANAGIRVISDSGILQVDSSYRNLHLIGKQELPHYRDVNPDGTINFSNGNFYYSPKSKTSILAYGMDSWYPDVMPRTDSEVTIRDYNGAIAHGDRMVQPWCSFNGRFSYDHPTNAGQSTFGMFTTSSRLTDIIRDPSGPIYVYSPINYYDTMPPQSAGVKCSVYEFDLIDLTGSETKSGMQVFDGDGKLVFDSEYRPMKVVNFFEVPVIWGGSGYQYPPTILEYPKINDGIKRKYAIAPLNAPTRFYNNYVGGYYNVNDYVMSGGNVAIDLFQWQESRILHYPQMVDQLVRDSPADHLYAGMTTINCLMLDVTGY